MHIIFCSFRSTFLCTVSFFRVLSEKQLNPFCKLAVSFICSIYRILGRPQAIGLPLSLHLSFFIFTALSFQAIIKCLRYAEILKKWWNFPLSNLNG